MPNGFRVDRSCFVLFCTQAHFNRYQLRPILSDCPSYEPGPSRTSRLVINLSSDTTERCAERMNGDWKEAKKIIILSVTCTSRRKVSTIMKAAFLQYVHIWSRSHLAVFRFSQGLGGKKSLYKKFSPCSKS